MKRSIFGSRGASQKILCRRDRLDYGLLYRHPNLTVYGYTVTSRRNKKYNCVAFAAGDCNWWWEPDDEPGYFWPKSVPKDYAIENYIKVFELQGYSICSDNSLEKGFEKVAVYEDQNGGFAHVCRQIETGEWISKLGRCEDISHSSLQALADQVYGFPAHYLRRRITLWIRIQKRLRSFLCQSEI